METKKQTTTLNITLETMENFKKAKIIACFLAKEVLNYDEALNFILNDFKKNNDK